MLIIVSAIPGSTLAHRVSNNVMAKYMVVVNNDNGSAISDTGNNNVYIFTTPQVAEIIEFDAEIPIAYLYTNGASVDETNVELTKIVSKSYTVKANDKFVIEILYG